MCVCVCILCLSLSIYIYLYTHMVRPLRAVQMYLADSCAESSAFDMISVFNTVWLFLVSIGQSLCY